MEIEGGRGGFVGENLPALPSYGNQKWFHCKEKTKELLKNSLIQAQAIYLSFLKSFKVRPTCIQVITNVRENYKFWLCAANISF